MLLCSAVCLCGLPQVDVKVVKEAKGRAYYFEHLPLLGETKVPRRGSVAVGDYVRVGMPLDAVRRNQAGHGGWCEAMMEVGGEWEWLISQTRHSCTLYHSVLSTPHRCKAYLVPSVCEECRIAR